MNFKQFTVRHAVQAGLVSLVCLSAFQVQADETGSLLSEYDLDGNGTIVAEEVTKTRTSLFGTVDLDKDGALSASEFVALREAQRMRRIDALFAAMDADRSKTVSLEEMTVFLPGKADVETLFAQAAGEDALLSSQEFMTLRLTEAGASTDVLWDFAYLDANHDQKLSVAEFASSLWKGVLPKLPEVKLPPIKLPEIKLPEVKLPEIKLPPVPPAVKEAVKAVLPDPVKAEIAKRITLLEEQITRLESSVASLRAKLATQTGLLASLTKGVLQRMEMDLATLKSRLAALKAPA